MLVNDEIAQIYGVLVTPRFFRFIDKSFPTYDILLSLKPDFKEINEIPERIQLYSDDIPT